MPYHHIVCINIFSNLSSSSSSPTLPKQAPFSLTTMYFTTALYPLLLLPALAKKPKPTPVEGCQPSCNNMLPYIILSLCPNQNLTPTVCQSSCVCDSFGGLTCGSHIAGCEKRDTEAKCGNWDEEGGRCDCSLCWARNQGGVSTAEGFVRVRRGKITEREVGDEA